jgi:hypothetical protein
MLHSAIVLTEEPSFVSGISDTQDRDQHSEGLNISSTSCLVAHLCCGQRLCEGLIEMEPSIVQRRSSAHFPLPGGLYSKVAMGQVRGFCIGTPPNATSSVTWADLDQPAPRRAVVYANCQIFSTRRRSSGPTALIFEVLIQWQRFSLHEP